MSANTSCGENMRKTCSQLRENNIITFMDMYTVSR